MSKATKVGGMEDNRDIFDKALDSVGPYGVTVAGALGGLIGGRIAGRIGQRAMAKAIAPKWMRTERMAEEVERAVSKTGNRMGALGAAAGGYLSYDAANVALKKKASRRK